MEKMSFKLAKKQERNLLFQAILKNDLKEESDVESDGGMQHLNDELKKELQAREVQTGAQHHDGNVGL